jgi:lipoprotein-releasing system permease protein
VSIWGIDPARRARVTRFKDVLLRQKDMPGDPSFDVPGTPDATGAFAGIGIVAEPNQLTDEYDQEKALHEMIGLRVLITTGTVEPDAEGDDTPKRKLVPFRLADIVFSGVHDLDTTFVYVPIETLRETLYPQKDAPATSVSIKLKAGVDPEVAVAQIRGIWKVFAAQELGWNNWRIDNFEVLTAHEMQRQLVMEFRKQMGILLLIFGVISFSAVVLVFCIFYMIVRLKRRDIAIIKSCGAASVSVAWIFLGFGITVGILGAGVGLLLGYIITRNINVVENAIRVVLGLNLWSSSVYMFDKIPNEMDWGWALTFMLLAVVAAALGALAPAVVAALTKPVEVLRYD